MSQRTRWFEYGEPVGDRDRVEAAIRTSYQTGPNEPARADDVRRGTVAIDALQADAIAEHVHSDGSVLLSALDDDAEDRLLGTFEASPWDRVGELVRDADCSCAEAVDYVATEVRGLSQSEWARRRGVNQSTVQGNVAAAREQLEHDDG